MNDTDDHYGIALAHLRHAASEYVKVPKGSLYLAAIAHGVLDIARATRDVRDELHQARTAEREPRATAGKVPRRRAVMMSDEEAAAKTPSGAGTFAEAVEAIAPAGLPEAAKHRLTRLAADAQAAANAGLADETCVCKPGECTGTGRTYRRMCRRDAAREARDEAQTTPVSRFEADAAQAAAPMRACASCGAGIGQPCARITTDGGKVIDCPVGWRHRTTASVPEDAGRRVGESGRSHLARVDAETAVGYREALERIALWRGPEEEALDAIMTITWGALGWSRESGQPFVREQLMGDICVCGHTRSHHEIFEGHPEGGACHHQTTHAPYVSCECGHFVRRVDARAPVPSCCMCGHGLVDHGYVGRGPCDYSSGEGSCPCREYVEKVVESDPTISFEPTRPIQPGASADIEDPWMRLVECGTCGAGVDEPCRRVGPGLAFPCPVGTEARKCANPVERPLRPCGRVIYGAGMDTGDSICELGLFHEDELCRSTAAVDQHRLRILPCDTCGAAADKPCGNMPLAGSTVPCPVGTARRTRSDQLARSEEEPYPGIAKQQAEVDAASRRVTMESQCNRYRSALKEVLRRGEVPDRFANNTAAEGMAQVARDALGDLGGLGLPRAFLSCRCGERIWLSGMQWVGESGFTCSRDGGLHRPEVT